jgi:hypothetical protein
MANIVAGQKIIESLQENDDFVAPAGQQATKKSFV